MVSCSDEREVETREQRGRTEEERDEGEESRGKPVGE